MGKDLGSQSLLPTRSPPVPATTVPRTHLGLSLPSPPPPDPRRECAAATLAPADLRRAGVGERGPLLPSAGRTTRRRPRADHCFRHQEGRGGGPRSRCFRRAVASGRLAPVPPPPRKAHHFPRPRAGPRQGVVAAVSALLRPGAARRPRPEGSTGRGRCHTNPGEHLGVLYLLPLRLRRRLLGPPLARTPSGTPRADAEKGASDDRV